ncbi:hypothetical protein KFK09_014949 [Dendrobium nobile]|uniref:Uncharacterized protein n=1 Tax=Dendrobium nobile TaxID=94219 RepID=A0A8T3B4I7_DENNO|nr:hypothetical protein KFK09_014949 [Dendrobium nobile]
MDQLSVTGKRADRGRFVGNGLGSGDQRFTMERENRHREKGDWEEVGVSTSASGQTRQRLGVEEFLACE